MLDGVQMEGEEKHDKSDTASRPVDNIISHIQRRASEILTGLPRSTCRAVASGKMANVYHTQISLPSPRNMIGEGLLNAKYLRVLLLEG